MLVWVLLCSLAALSHADYSVPSSFCVTQTSINTQPYKYYTEGSLSDGTNYSAGVWYDNRPVASGTYTFESVESVGLSTCRGANPSTTGCLLCQYDADPYWSECATQSPNTPPTVGGSRAPSFQPMFGPCLSDMPSQLMQCAQHPALFPSGFVGTYFYPLQQPFANYNLAFTNPYPLHLFLSTDSIESQIVSIASNQASPSTYGMGKAAVQDSMATLQVVNISNKSQIMVNETAQFMHAYNTDGGWVMWAQHFCSAACHRDSQYTMVQVVPSDYANNPEFSYLSRMTTPVSVPILKCNVCSPGYAAYTWLDATVSAPEGPQAINLNIYAQTCFPWFGVIPIMVPSPYDPSGNGYGFENTTLHFLEPLDEYRPVATPCPVNTYNRVCAHTKRYYYWQYMVYANANVLPMAAPFEALYKCTPCPSGGWHTNNQTGAWFCYPPPGNYMPNVHVGWASRDTLQTEFECGYAPEHCLQCATYYPAVPAGTLPSDFNELVIFSTLLYTQPCAANMYCPDALTQLPCPAATPYSPGGIWNVSQCGCFRGTYLASGTCVACQTGSLCPTGTYLPQTCNNYDGQTADQPCTSCTNVPASNATVMPGSSYVLPQGVGVCSFRCAYGHTLQSSTGTCVGSTMQCVAASMVINGAWMYNPAAATTFDVFDATKCTSSPLNLALSTLMKQSSSWQPTSTQCICPGYDLCYNARYPQWYDISSNVVCIPCSPHAFLPANATFATNAGLIGDVTLAPSVVCTQQISCASGYYLNTTVWACQSCTARAALVCPSGKTQLQGGGCMGNFAPFNLANPSADCIACQLSLAAIPPQQYLNLLQTPSCAYAPCTPEPSPVGTHYLSSVCGGTVNNVWTACAGSNTCGVGYYQKVLCSNMSNMVCAPCLAWNPGSYIPHGGGCSNGGTTYTSWTLCPANSYCIGAGNVTACPVGMLSQPGAKSASECYCALGTVSNGQQQCVPFFCPNTTFSSAPNSYFSQTSPFYMSMNMALANPTTECLPCGSETAFSRGIAGGFDTCVCPKGDYGVLVGGDELVCMSCPSLTYQPACSSSLQTWGPGICWEGDMMGVASCVCAPPPFGSLTGGGMCSFTCQSGFVASPSGGRSASEASGSALYVAMSQSQWTQFVWPSSSAGAVAALAVIPYTYDTVASSAAAQYVIWSTQGSLNVQITQIPIAGVTYAHASNGDYYQYNVWPVSNYKVIGNGVALSIVGLGISPWPSSGGTVHVAAVVLATQQSASSLVLFPKQLNTLSAGSLWSEGGAVGPEAGFGNVTLVTQTNPQFVSIAYYYASGTDAFYIAYNNNHACGGLVYTMPWTTPNAQTSLPICHISTQSITAFSIGSIQGGVLMFYMAFGSAVYTAPVLSSDISQSATLLFPDAVPFANTAIVSGLLPLFTTYPNLILNLAPLTTATVSNTGLRVADVVRQLVPVEIEGMPWGTAPILSPVGLATSINTGVIVVANGTGLFAINVGLCPPDVSTNFPKYWDGGDPLGGSAKLMGQQCLPHQCVRQAKCNAQTQHVSANKCVCNDGYYLSTTCLPCPTQKYCVNAVQTNCPGNTYLASTGGSSVYNCTCSKTTGQYMSPITGQCSACDRSGWCPNAWLMLACPGQSTGGLVGSNTFPSTCACASGYTGPGCTPCPADSFCAVTPTVSATNMALTITTTSVEALNDVNATLDFFEASLLQYFQSQPQLQYLANPAILAQRLYMEYVPATNWSQPVFMIMLQVLNDADAAKAEGWGAALIGELPFAITAVNPVNFQPYTSDVPNNTAVPCPAGKVQAESMDSCICAPGFASSSSSSCQACPVNSFKKAAGTGACTPCAIGTVASATGASVCTPQTSSAAASSTFFTTPVIIGFGVGGAALLITCTLVAVFCLHAKG